VLIDESDLLRRVLPLDCTSTGRSPASSERSATRAARLAERTDA
jgi:hypothetical protein